MEHPHKDDEAVASWLAMGPIGSRTYAVVGRATFLSFPRTRDSMRDLASLRGAGISMRFSGFFRYWKVEAESNPLALQSFLARNRFAPMPRSEVELAFQITEGTGPNRFSFSNDTYRIRCVKNIENLDLLIGIQNDLGDHGHVEWRDLGCDIVVRRNECHRLIRLRLLQADFSLSSDFLLPTAQPTVGPADAEEDMETFAPS